MSQLQLPQFQPHPECAAALLTLDQAIALVKSGHLSIACAQWLFPHAKALLPQVQSKG
ncbi:MAG: hypothetical protein KME35_23910 [Aphanocapsa sp. GSE-SYN-MK-11-07L]|jgi:hypothetical protein|nr:hypothetical protein [Aphanocapsa sp. GSE-SYN-MK-11-07L]